MQSETIEDTTASADFLSGGGELGARMRALDWSATSLGPPSAWPQSLKTCVRIILTSRQPMFVWWGEELINLYNDAYKSIVGGKHPEALGQPASVVWSEIWNEVAPRAATAMQTNEGTYDEALLLIMERYGYAEETYYTFSYSPVPNDLGGTGGILCANTDDTQRIIGERQLALLRELAAATADARTFEEACMRSAASLSANPRDILFAMIYLLDRERDRLVLAGAAGIGADHPAAPRSVAMADRSLWPFGAVLETQKPVVVTDLRSRSGELPAGAWDRPPEQAVALPIASSGQGGQSGVLIIGLNPFRLYDDSYSRFIDLIGGQIAASIANAQAYEDERKRSESLAELDRAKTAFFSNVSHEFRTPLTLMLGPLEDILAKSNAEVLPENRELLTVMHRNGQRLMKLVNTLLNFSRIEAGRVQASYQPTDLSAYTAELASVFRAAVEKAGMRLVIDAPPLGEPAYIDREMWEKIVLNLVSNAFKYTLDGEIAVSVRKEDGHAVVSVRDTGIGIPAAEVPKLFNRFHRVEGARGRTLEGTGIGLALVQELARLHGGNVTVRSREGEGSTFEVTVPLGREHLPQDRVGAEKYLAATNVAATSYVEEALRWLPDAELSSQDVREAAALVAGRTTATQRRKVVLADDNADMRDYVHRLLLPFYDVVPASDGLEALRLTATEKPDLVLTDVMMPNLDGFGLLRELRTEPETASIPVIILSARAGEEARVEGLQAGADDYVVKPFSARELLARVGSMLAVTQVRVEANEALRRSEERYRSLIEATAAIVWTGPSTGLFESEQPGWSAFTGQTFEELRGSGWADAIHPDDREPTLSAWQAAVAAGSIYQTEHRLRRADGEYRHMSARAVPLRSDDGSIREWIGVHTDLTVERRLQQTLEAERLGLRDIFMRAPAFIATLRGPEHVFEIANPLYMQLVGEKRDVVGKPVREALPEVEGQGLFELLDRVYQTAEPFIGTEVRVALQRGDELEERYADFVYQPMRGPDGAITGIFVHGNDVSEQVHARRIVERQAEELERANLALLDQMVLNKTITDNAASCLFMMDENGYATFMNPAAEEVTGYTLDEIRERPLHEVIHHQRPDGTPYPISDCPIEHGREEMIPLKNHREVFVRKDGTPFPVSCHLAPLSGRLGGAVLEFRDISEELRAQEALREADRRKDEFIATLSHELRTPLTAILGWARLLQMPDMDEETRAGAIETINRSAQAQAQLIDDVLDISRITTGKVQIASDRVDVSAVAAAAVETVKLAAAAKGVRLTPAVRSGELLVLGDANRLQQVIWNLLSNAIKFTPEGGDVRLDVVRRNGIVAIEVRDTGAGIRSDFLPHIFEPFRQAESTTTRVHGGLGLGLSIVRYLVELHGGRISAESEGDGKGATFVVELPSLRNQAATRRLAAPERRESQGVSGDSPQLDGLSVLVIDDQHDVREYISAVLRRQGASVRAAESVCDGIEQVTAELPDVILCDIAMPHEDGYAFIRWLRADPDAQQLPVIAISAFGRENEEERVRSAGFSGFIRKPVEPEDLARAVAGAVPAD
jgi:PAS domain S-box-containing protein